MEGKTEKRKKNWMKNPPRGDWRKFDSKIKVEYTILTRSWTWREEDCYTEKHLAPWGMVKEATEALKSENVGNSFNKLPNEVKKYFADLCESNFDKEDINMEVNDGGNMGFGTFSYIYCSMCKSKSLLSFMEEFRDMLPNNPTVEDVLSNWDKIKAKKKFLKSKFHKAICGCLLPNDPDVMAGLSAKHFILRPISHTPLHDKFTVAAASSRSQDGPLPKKSKPDNTLVQSASTGAVQIDDAIPVTVTDKSGHQSTQYLKNKGKQLKTTFIFFLHGERNRYA